MSDPKLDPRFKNAVFAAPTWKGYVRQYAHDLEQALEQVSDSALDEASRVIGSAVSAGRRIFVAGNGGSAAIADHLCCDWTKGTHSEGLPPLRTHSLASNVALLTAIANDFGYDAVFSRQLEMLGSAGDVLLLISSSGNSPNVVAAAESAKAMGITTIGLTGFSGGALAARADISLHVPYANYGLVEDCHQILMHTFGQLFARDREPNAGQA
ncbi:MAG TPA: SIS domain-containing protein [Gemmatimonadaceae bacterium]|nr:SIS domain-containing protein [Gemmatimonadaceae bacterium]